MVSCLSKTSLKIHHTLTRQLHGIKAQCVQLDPQCCDSGPCCGLKQSTNLLVMVCGSVSLPADDVPSKIFQWLTVLMKGHGRWMLKWWSAYLDKIRLRIWYSTRSCTSAGQGEACTLARSWGVQTLANKLVLPLINGPLQSSEPPAQNVSRSLKQQ
jgi:hypothetical protein